MMKLNIKNKDHFTLYGSTALNEPGFKRFSDKELESIKDIAPKVYHLARESSGIQAHFMSDSSIIIASVVCGKAHGMTNSSPLGQLGVDLYVFDEAVKQYVLCGIGRPQLHLTKYETILAEFDDRKMRKFILNLPLLTPVQSLTLTFEDGQVLPLKEDKKKVMMYGTSIMHGACASRPGMSYTNILSRRLNVEVLNYGFNGSAYNEKEIAKILSKREVDLFIIDSEANSGDGYLIDRLDTFIDAFRETQPNTKIIVTNRIPFIKDYYSKEQQERKQRHEAFLNDFSKRRSDIDYYDVYSKLKYDLDITSDGVHPSDYGMVKLADIFEAIIKPYITNK